MGRDSNKREMSHCGQLFFSTPTGSGLLEFGEFCQLAARFLVEEDEEALKKELKEAFRIYDKEGEAFCAPHPALPFGRRHCCWNPLLFFLILLPGNGYISTDTLKEILRELDNKLTEEDLLGIIEEVDEDGSGTLDFDGKRKFPFAGGERGKWRWDQRTKLSLSSLQSSWR